MKWQLKETSHKIKHVNTLYREWAHVQRHRRLDPQRSVGQDLAPLSLNIIASGSSPHSLTFNPRNFPHVTAMNLDCPTSLYVSQADYRVSVWYNPQLNVFLNQVGELSL